VDGGTGEAVEPASAGPPAAELERASAAAAEPSSAAAEPSSAAAEPSWVRRAVWRGIWQLIAAVLVTAAGLWSLRQARTLVRYLILAQLLTFALEPAVAWLHQKRRWRRGSATGLLLGGILVLFVLLGVLLVPVLANGVNGAIRQMPSWIDKLNAFTQEHFNTTVVSASSSRESSQAVSNAAKYLQQHAGDVLGAVGSLLGAVFGLLTVGLFTFYLTADGPQIRRALLSRMPPERQQRALWAYNTAIEKTGGYLYSNLLLALINGGLMLVTLLLVGVPYALPLALFEGVVAEFIPIVGTYVAGAVPVLVALASLGPGPASIVLAEILVYQQVENYLLTPRISQKTMKLNAGLAFGAAMAGGAVGGVIGAFFGLPIAAVIQSFVSNYYSGRYEVVESDLTRIEEPKPPKSAPLKPDAVPAKPPEPPSPGQRRRWRRRGG
jgi:predicted PurR-regulated permease PerM